MKEKKRYINYHVHSPATLQPGDIARAVSTTLATYLGELGYGAAGIQLVATTPTGGIIKTSHTSVDQVKSGLLMITNINEQPALAHSTNVSGILNKAQGGARHA